MKNDDKFIWSDGWCIEDDKAWFVDGRKSILYCTDLITGECKYIAKIPYGDSNPFRFNPCILKIGNEIFCMPDFGTDIWIYDVKDDVFSHFPICSLEGVRMSCNNFWKYDGRIFVLSVGLKKIVEINVDKKTIDAFYPITDMPEEKLGRSVRVGADIYVVLSLSNKVYQFNLESKRVTAHILSEIEGGLYTICFDGAKFWLSGYKKEIYVWDQKKNDVETLCDFSEEFGEYDFSGKEEPILDLEKREYKFPAFLDARVIGENVWLIPFKTNKIIYINKNTRKMQTFEMPNEEETRESLRSNGMRSKYLIQYVAEERYLGLFSLKNNWLVEIDTKELRFEIKNFRFDYERYADELLDYVFIENKEMDRDVFRYLLAVGKQNENVMKNGEVGKQIYQKMCYEAKLVNDLKIF